MYKTMNFVIYTLFSRTVKSEAESESILETDPLAPDGTKSDGAKSEKELENFRVQDQLEVTDHHLSR